VGKYLKPAREASACLRQRRSVVYASADVYSVHGRKLWVFSFFFLLLFVYDLTVLYLYAIDGDGGGEVERMEIKTRNLGGWANENKLNDN